MSVRELWVSGSLRKMSFRRVSLVQVGGMFSEKFGWQDEIVANGNGDSSLTYYVGEFRGWRIVKFRDFQTAKRGIDYVNIGGAYNKEEVWKKVWEEDLNELYNLMREDAIRYAKENGLPFFDLTGRGK